MSNAQNAEFSKQKAAGEKYPKRAGKIEEWIELVRKSELYLKKQSQFERSYIRYKYLKYKMLRRFLWDGGGEKTKPNKANCRPSAGNPEQGDMTEGDLKKQSQF